MLRELLHSFNIYSKAVWTSIKAVTWRCVVICCISSSLQVLIFELSGKILSHPGWLTKKGCSMATGLVWLKGGGVWGGSLVHCPWYREVPSTQQITKRNHFSKPADLCNQICNILVNESFCVFFYGTVLEIESVLEPAERTDEGGSSCLRGETDSG